MNHDYSIQLELLTVELCISPLPPAKRIYLSFVNISKYFKQQLYQVIQLIKLIRTDKQSVQLDSENLLLFEWDNPSQCLIFIDKFVDGAKYIASSPTLHINQICGLIVCIELLKKHAWYLWTFNMLDIFDTLARNKNNGIQGKVHKKGEKKLKHFSFALTPT